jgi:predicted ATPase
VIFARLAQSAPITPAPIESGAEALLERSAELAALAEELAAVQASGQGRIVLIAGEAGIGKTALVHEFTASAGGVRVLAGACEALNTPRPLGPLQDIAADIGGPLADALKGDAGSALAPLLDELRTPTVLVLEDLHWADEATLDMLRLLGRRVSGVPALVLGTHRDVGAADPLRVALGELPATAVRRLQLRSLSPEAVASLARPHGADPHELFERTGGNPFYVTEALAAGGALPDSVRDAVLARAARLGGPARRLLDAVAVAPPRAELWLLEAIAADELGAVERCIATGMLRAEGDAIAFRHEIARTAIEEAMTPDRQLALNRQALPVLAARTYDLARLAHHAEAAGDAAAVVRYAPAAGDLAGARLWGGQAIALAERLLQTETLVHALNNVGTAELTAGIPEGAEKLERSLELALKGG